MFDFKPPADRVISKHEEQWVPQTKSAGLFDENPAPESLPRKRSVHTWKVSEVLENQRQVIKHGRSERKRCQAFDDASSDIKLTFPGLGAETALHGTLSGITAPDDMVG